MADNDQTLDKRLVICPLSFALGYIQNYRVTERPNKGCLESRPVKDTDAFADDFFKVLHAPKGETVTVTHSSGKEIQLRGLGQDGAQALKFSMKSGLNARQNAVKAVNAGEVRAPKKNWDKTYGEEKVYTYTDPTSKQEFRFQLGGGKPIDDLKSEFPEMYGTKSSRKSKSDDDEGMIDDDALAALEGDDIEAMSSDEPETQADAEDIEAEVDEDYTKSDAVSEPIASGDDDVDDDLQALADDMDGEGAYAEEGEEAYAAVEVAESPTDEILDEDYGTIEDTTEEGQSAVEANQEGNLQGAAKLRHELKEKTGSGRVQQFDDPRSTAKPQKQGKGADISAYDRSGGSTAEHSMSMRIRRPEGTTKIDTQAIRYMAGDMEIMAFKIKCGNCSHINWFAEGANHCRECGKVTELTTQ